MKEILLTRGYVALVDDEDYALVMRYRWVAHGNGESLYARSTHRINGKQVLLHRFIMNALADPRHIDHKNRNGLDCRKVNLRFASRSQNRINTKTINASGFKGVYRKGRLWFARIGPDHLRIGGFVKVEDAAKAYDKAARVKYGEFARLNFPDTKEDRVVLPKRGTSPRRSRSGKGVECVTTGLAFNSATEAGRHMGLCPESISKVCRGKFKTIHGFVFRFTHRNFEGDLNDKTIRSQR